MIVGSVLALAGAAFCASLASGQAPPTNAIDVPPGFAVDLVGSAQAGQGSWVALEFASETSLYLSSQGGPLLRGTLAPDGASLLRLERIETPFHGAEGLLADGATLWVVAEGEVNQGGGLWKLVDAQGDGTFEEIRRVLEFGGGGEHGLHGIRKGQDGALYITAGNHVPPPAWIAANSPVRHWAEDFLQEREWDARGHAVGVLAPGGFILRVDPKSCEGRGVCEAQLWCAGMRNAYDLVQLPCGEWFTWDSDMEWDIGAPWYRKPRIAHLVSGGDSGWRSGSANSPHSFADHLPAVCETDESSPTGVEWAGGFGPAWRNTILVGDWAYGRIVAVGLREQGAGFVGEWSTFARGRPMPVTDLAFRRSGELYVTTGGRGLSSGLYRIRVADEGLAVKSAPRAQEASSAAAAARALRHRLEELHTRIASDRDIEEIARGLASTDRSISFAARVALENQPVDRWREIAERAGPLGWLALARAGEAQDRALALGLVIEAASESESTPARLLLARVATVAIARGAGPSTASLLAQCAAAMDDWYPSNDAALNELLLPILVEGGRSEIARRALSTVDPQRPSDGMRVLMALRSMRSGWDAQTRMDYANALGRCRLLRGGLSVQGFVDAIEADARGAFLTAPEDVALLRPPVAAPTGAAATLPSRAGRRVHPWTVEEIVPAMNFDARTRDLARGKRVFEEASCARCHRIAGEGGSTGPDLTGVGSRLGRRDLVVTIFEPSVAISDQYADEVFTLADGGIIIGRIVDETPTELVIRTNPVEDERERVLRTSVVLRARSDSSPMPRGLLDAFDHGEIIDLLAYLESAPASPSPPK